MKYHGKSSIAGVAHAFEGMERAFPLLSPGDPPRRYEITIESGFPAEGEPFEMVTRGGHRWPLRVTPVLGGPEAFGAGSPSVSAIEEL